VVHFAAVPGEVRYADCDGLDIAYAIYGDGPVDVVLFPGLAAHLELNEEIPFYRALIERLAGSARFIVFDKRGCGLSDRSRLGSAEERMDDARAVLDAVGSERAAMIATADGGPMAMLFAATYPDRVSSLALASTYARLSSDPETGYVVDYSRGITMEGHFGRWGSGDVLDVVFAGHPGDERTRRTLARWERNIATPRLAMQQILLNNELDIRYALPLIAAPTLVVHNTGDPIFVVELGRYLAGAIPGARLVEQDLPFHIGWTEDADAMARILADFALGNHEPARVGRVLATVLFTDVVSSTEAARSAGDARWRATLDTFEERADRVAAAYGGRVVKTTGDGVVATFDGPGRAVGAARALRESVAPLGLDLRTGLHTGEVELRGTDIGGLAVHLAARIQSTAAPGEVVVSRTVVDLTLGSSIQVEPRGAHELKGFDVPFDLYAVV